MPVTINGSGTMGTMAQGGITGSATIIAGTVQNSTSGTSIDFTGIPSWVRRITVMFNGVSTNGSSGMQVQIGSGSITTSGYTSISINSTSINNVNGIGSTAGFAIASGAASDNTIGHMVLTLISSNTWISSHAMNRSSWGLNGGGSSPALGGALDRVRITSINGTDTFDAGTINILYE